MMIGSPKKARPARSPIPFEIAWLDINLDAMQAGSKTDTKRKRGAHRGNGGVADKAL